MARIALAVKEDKKNSKIKELEAKLHEAKRDAGFFYMLLTNVCNQYDVYALDIVVDGKAFVVSFDGEAFWMQPAEPWEDADFDTPHEVM